MNLFKANLDPNTVDDNNALKANVAFAKDLLKQLEEVYQIVNCKITEYHDKIEYQLYHRLGTIPSVSIVVTVKEVSFQDNWGAGPRFYESLNPAEKAIGQTWLDKYPKSTVSQFHNIKPHIPLVKDSEKLSNDIKNINKIMQSMGFLLR